VRKLIENGANFSLKNKNKQTPFDAASSKEIKV